MKSSKVFATVNGRECYQVSIFDHGLLYGDGIFETFRVFEGRAFRIDDHIDRLFASAKGIQLRMPYTRTGMLNLIRKTYQQAEVSDAFVRIIITRGVGEQGMDAKCKPNVIIIINQRTFKPLQKIRVSISQRMRAQEGTIAPEIKSLNYGNDVLARLDAMAQGADDTILLNSKRNITEATTSNIFLVKNAAMLTPTATSGILEGIVRKVVMEEFPVIEKELTVHDLLSADEVFLTGTVHFVTSVQSIEKTTFKKYDTAKKVLERLLTLTKTGTRL